MDALCTATFQAQKIPTSMQAWVQSTTLIVSSLSLLVAPVMLPGISSSACPAMPKGWCTFLMSHDNQPVTLVDVIGDVDQGSYRVTNEAFFKVNFTT